VEDLPVRAQQDFMGAHTVQDPAEQYVAVSQVPRIPQTCQIAEAAKYRWNLKDCLPEQGGYRVFNGRTIVKATVIDWIVGGGHKLTIRERR